METRSGLADLARLKALIPLPETTDELCAVAHDVKADVARDVRLGSRATEREVKRLSASGELAQYRMVHFATHGALAGELDGTHEPGLVLTPPDTAGEEDDGYLSASEIAALKLDADWVVLSACNTAAGNASNAEALSGLGRTDDALQMIDEAHRHARRLNDTNGVQNAYAIRVRVLLQAGAAAEACATEPPDLADALPSMKGEVLGSRALALVTIGRIGEAGVLAEQARSATLGIEAHALSFAVSAVSAVKERSYDVLERCERLVDHVFEAGSCDFAVTAYRSNPELLSMLLASTRIRDKTVFLVRRAGDDGRLETLGMSSAALVDPVISLTPREREVYDLLCEGLSNAEIGRQLFITPGTVKVHVHHVFDKLGIRSRTALALNSARERYAAPADTSPSDGEESD